MPFKDRQKQLEYNRKYSKKHYQKKKRYYYERAKEGRLRLREKFENLKKTFSCKCGQSHIATLDFHHIDPKQKEFEVSQAIAIGWSWTKIEKEIEKCIVMCANCHRIFHFEQRNKARSTGEVPAESHKL